jgi:hypothetical protein
MICFFEKPYLIKTSPEIIEKARTFTNQVITTVNYLDSKQFNQTKVWQDHFISKIGEEAVYQVFAQFTEQIIPPDYTIYQGKNKSWAADLNVNGIDLAVKTQTKTSANKFGLSWTFQAGLFRRDRILDQPEAWVCFVQCDDTNKNYHCLVYPPMQIKTLMF